MFWAVYDDTLLRDTFKFSYKPDEWSFDFVHVFGNGDIDRLDGVALFPKNLDITDKELEHRFYANKKEIRIMASTPREYEKYSFKNFKLNSKNILQTPFFHTPQPQTLNKLYAQNLLKNGRQLDSGKWNVTARPRRQPRNSGRCGLLLHL